MSAADEHRVLTIRFLSSNLSGIEKDVQREEVTINEKSNIVAPERASFCTGWAAKCCPEQVK